MRSFRMLWVWAVGRVCAGGRGHAKSVAVARFRTTPDLLLSFQTHQGRLSERPMETDCKSVAKATKVRILHLPPCDVSGDRRQWPYGDVGPLLFCLGCCGW